MTSLDWQVRAAAAAATKHAIHKPAARVSLSLRPSSSVCLSPPQLTSLMSAIVQHSYRFNPPTVRCLTINRLPSTSQSSRHGDSPMFKRHFIPTFSINRIYGDTQ